MATQEISGNSQRKDWMRLIKNPKVKRGVLIVAGALVAIGGADRLLSGASTTNLDENSGLVCTKPDPYNAAGSTKDGSLVYVTGGSISQAVVSVRSEMGNSWSEPETSTLNLGRSMQVGGSTIVFQQQDGEKHCLAFK